MESYVEIQIRQCNPANSQLTRRSKRSLLSYGLICPPLNRQMYM